MNVTFDVTRYPYIHFTDRCKVHVWLEYKFKIIHTTFVEPLYIKIPVMACSSVTLVIALNIMIG
jgi:hypothetical protein